MTDLIKRLQYLSRVTKDYDQEHMTSADYEMIPTVTKQAVDRIEELEKKCSAYARADQLFVEDINELEAKLAKAVETLQEIEADFCQTDAALKYAIHTVLAELGGK